MSRQLTLSAVCATIAMAGLALTQGSLGHSMSEAQGAGLAPATAGWAVPELPAPTLLTR
ncbi:MAG: hypothetical protein IE933_07340 [Sphingomonadales bacterium]|nr:hypothetical protein [Sphingomonadales bacterium]MBD3773469.1 hypothetical protein [Paracoccaceae bacterium]